MKHTLIKTAPAPTEAEAFSGCGHGPIPAARRGPNAPPVFVNGVAIPETAIAQEAQNHAAPSGAEARAAAARALVIRELLLQRATALGLTPTPETDSRGRTETAEEALMRQLLATEAPASEPTDAECLRLYSASAAQFTAPELYEASHILVAPSDESPAAWDEAKLRAMGALEALQHGAEFAQLARALSACPTASQGGSLGQLSCGDLAPSVESALLALTPGTLADSPVRSQHGWHVLRLDRVIPAKTLPFETVAPILRARLLARAELATSARYIARLAADAEIEGLSLGFGGDA